MTTSSSFVFVGARRPSGEGDPAPYLRRAFSVGHGLRRAELVVTALGVLEAYVNGERLGDEVLAPGWT